MVFNNVERRKVFICEKFAERRIFLDAIKFMKEKWRKIRGLFGSRWREKKLFQSDSGVIGGKFGDLKK